MGRIRVASRASLAVALDVGFEGDDGDRTVRVVLGVNLGDRLADRVDIMLAGRLIEDIKDDRGRPLFRGLVVIDDAIGD